MRASGFSGGIGLSSSKSISSVDSCPEIPLPFIDFRSRLLVVLNQVYHNNSYAICLSLIYDSHTLHVYNDAKTAMLKKIIRHQHLDSSFYTVFLVQWSVTPILSKGHGIILRRVAISFKVSQVVLWAAEVRLFSPEVKSGDLLPVFTANFSLQVNFGVLLDIEREAIVPFRSKSCEGHALCSRCKKYISKAK